MARNEGAAGCGCNDSHAAPATSAPGAIKDVVKKRYGEAARQVRTGRTSCCGTRTSESSCCDPITSNLYDAGQTGELPQEAVLASLGFFDNRFYDLLNLVRLPTDVVLAVGGWGDLIAQVALGVAMVVAGLRARRADQGAPVTP